MFFITMYQISAAQRRVLRNGKMQVILALIEHDANRDKIIRITVINFMILFASSKIICCCLLSVHSMLCGKMM